MKKNNQFTKPDKFYNLKILFPEIASEWHPSKNGNLKPQDMLPGSGIQRWWLCKERHSFSMSPNKRTNKGNRKNYRGCPYCAGKKIGYGNDLQSLHPSLAKEWHPTKNKPLSPEEFTSGSSKKVWWVCSRRHEWKASIAGRFNGSGCPKCSNQTSRPELYFFCELKTLFKSVEHRKQVIDKEIDIFINDINLCIEYDGSYWHKNPTIDFAKRNHMIEKGFNVINVREKPLKKLSDNDVIINPNSKFSESFIYFLKFFKNNNLLSIHQKEVVEKYIIHNKQQNEQEYRKLLISLTNRLNEKNSLAILYPELAKEWHPTKNKPLTPSDVPAFTHDKVWWLCPRGHERFKSVDNQSTKVKNNSKNICSDCNTISIKYPELAKEWHPTKNKPLTPSEIKPGSNKKRWWICKEDHEYESSPNHRTGKKSRGCPYCANQKLGYGNDLQSKNISLAKEWHPTRNKSLKPSEVFPNTKQKVWWQCKDGHEWIAQIANRNNGKGCPFCSERTYIYKKYNNGN